MNQRAKKYISIISEPSYIHVECPYCYCEIDINYGEFSSSMYSSYWGDWEGELITCEYCDKDFEIGDVIYD